MKAKDFRLLRTLRKLCLMLLDVALINMATVVAIILIAQVSCLDRYGSFAMTLSTLALFAFYSCGLHKRIWAYFGPAELLVILKAVTAIFICQLALNILLFANYLPPGVFLLGWMMALFLITGSRLFWRILRSFKRLKQSSRQQKPVLIVGAGGAGATVARAIQENDTGVAPVGFIDDSAEKQNMKLYNLPVLGKREDLPAVVEKYGVKEIIIAIPTASSKTLRELVGFSRLTPARLKITPSVINFINGVMDLSQIKDVEYEDLLHREPVKVNLDDIASYLDRRVVLVTGAGGSIGSELCRQLASFGPSLIILLGRGENSIYEINMDLANHYPTANRVVEIADIRDRYRVEDIFSRYRPDVVFHAAAHKHVPLIEKSPYEAFINNVMGTLNVARAADAYKAKVFVLISTDKAVNPQSVMGATKRVAEMIIQKMNEESRTVFAAVRFGNVLGSRGSVVHLFKKQIAAGGPVTVTDPNMVRYFMTIPEAVQLVIQAGAMARGGEIFILDMGEPVKIADLARDMIILSGYKPDVDIPITYTGVRPGEKLFEELFTEGERVNTTVHERIMVTGSRYLEADSLNELISQKYP
ncbi:MAG: nucleoside-diphosphate sugar epimerase/dehydratase, partial [Desulfotomaculaceae bacterium]|nr:nucleoside-diphosphate sugar epimerase/dehydratase [Desulfotomaculaceae bacterium]